MIASLKRRGGLLSLLIAAIVAGVLVGSAIASNGASSDEPNDDAFKPVTGSHRLGTDVADTNGEAPWTVRRYRGKTGLDCYELGQHSDGQFGRTWQGHFSATADDQPSGTCGDLQAAPAGVLVTMYGRGNGGRSVDRSVLYGIATADVTSVVADGPGESRTLKVDDSGTFVTVYSGRHSFKDVAVTFNYSDGTQRHLPMHPS